MRVSAVFIVCITALPLLAQDGATHADWSYYGGTQLAWRYSALNQSNVKKLAPAWAFQTGDYDGGLQSTPIVIDGVLFFPTTHDWVFALEAATGKMLWQYKYPLPRGTGGNIPNRGLAVGAGKVFVGTYDDYVVALDQKTGAEVWKVATNDSKQCGCSITSAPLFVKDKVVVGVAGGDGSVPRIPHGFRCKDRAAGVAILYDSREGGEGQRDLEGRQAGSLAAARRG